MPERVVTCPHCTAPITPPSVFARSIVCRHCGSTVAIDRASVSVDAYRKAHASWCSPETYGYRTWSVVGDVTWALGGKLASGTHRDVYIAERARWPTERAVFKVHRRAEDADVLDREWDTLEALQEKAGAFELGIPQPIQRGEISSGAHTGKRVSVLRWMPGFVHTLEDAKRAYPRGVDPKIVPWVWRRILEVLTFTHRAGFVHGAVVPAHVVVHEREHGARLVGWSAARPLAWGRGRGDQIGAREARAADIVASARTVATILDLESRGAPEPLANLVRAVAGGIASAASATGIDIADAWSLRERVGAVAQQTFGPPSFNPLRIP